MMLRILKYIFAGNFLISMLVYGGYIVVCLSRGVHMDYQLGFIGHHGRGGPRWALVAFLQIQLLAIYVWQRFSDNPATFRHRVGYLLYGVLILFFSGSQLLIAYIGCSDVSYMDYSAAMTPKNPAATKPTIIPGCHVGVFCGGSWARIVRENQNNGKD